MRNVFYAVSPKWRYRLRRFYYFPIDLYEGISGKRPKMVPPKGAIFTGSGDFVLQGENFLKHFIALGNLQPHHRVLDIGSGMGRMAVPLTKYLSVQGSYDGFDIIPMGINWCNKHIASQYPNFHFKLATLNNRLYTDQGKPAASFEFPYSDNSFDFVILTSVFTHMMPEDVRRYMVEINRILKTGGTCFATFFILDEDAIGFMNKEIEPFFPYPKGNYFLHNLKVPEANIGFIPSFIEMLCTESNLQKTAFYPGWWSGRNRENAKDFQDILIFSKK